MVSLHCPGVNCFNGGRTDALWFGWCRDCWYSVCGGDQAANSDLDLPPNVWLSQSENSVTASQSEGV